MNEIKPVNCPECDAVPVILHFPASHPRQEMKDKWPGLCPDCQGDFAKYGGGSEVFETKQAAIEAWNAGVEKWKAEVGQ